MRRDTSRRPAPRQTGGSCRQTKRQHRPARRDLAGLTKGNRTMATPQTIADMIADVGLAQNYAEQRIFGRMLSDAVDYAAASSPAMRFAAWSRALARAHAILTFREHGATPPIAPAPDSTDVVE